VVGGVAGGTKLTGTGTGTGGCGVVAISGTGCTDSDEELPPKRSITASRIDVDSTDSDAGTESSVDC
jgi:hypothetical protein